MAIVHLSLRVRSLSALLCSIFICLIASSCKEMKVEDKSKELAKELHEKSYPPGSPHIPEPIPNRINHRVYLDASISMSGYVTGNREDLTTFDNFIDELGYVLPGCQIYRYGQASRDRPQDINIANLLTQVSFDLRLHRPRFYNLLFNPDDRLIEELVNENPPGLSVLITDGVYSDALGDTQSRVVEKIRKWMERGRTFGILILRSRFSGPFYSELRRMMLPDVSAPARPFYAFIFSPTLREFNELREGLRRNFKDMGLILFTDEAINVELKIPSRAKGSYSLSTPPKTPYWWQMFKADMFDSKTSVAEPVYEINSRLDPAYSLKELGFNAEWSYYLWKGGQFERIASTPPSGFSCKVGGSQVSPKLLKDTRSDYGFYQIRLNALVRFIRDDIRALSTRDDSNSDNAEKTYKFYELIMALTDAHIKSRLANKVSPTLYLTVANK